MAGYLQDSCCLIWSVMVWLVRILLLMIAMVVLLIQIFHILALFYLSYSLKINRTFPGTVGLFEYFESALMIVVILIGCKATMSRNRLNLYSFAFVSSLFCLYYTYKYSQLVAEYPAGGRMNAVADKLKDLEADYDWSQQSQRPITKLIDTIQIEGKCCGIDGPSDWNRHRPDHVPRESYPISCCKTKFGRISDLMNKVGDATGLVNPTCPSSDISNIGCRSSLLHIGDLINDRNISVGILMGFLSILAILISCLSCNNPEDMRRDHISLDGRSMLNNPNIYRRFEGSVYVRRDNPNTYAEGGPKVPLVYPEATEYGVQPPPPSYSSVTRY